jgi:hypothetical protein
MLRLKEQVPPRSQAQQTRVTSCQFPLLDSVVPPSWHLQRGFEVLQSMNRAVQGDENGPSWRKMTLRIVHPGLSVSPESLAHLQYGRMWRAHIHFPNGRLRLITKTRLDGGWDQALATYAIVVGGERREGASGGPNRSVAPQRGELAIYERHVLKVACARAHRTKMTRTRIG